MTMLAHMGLSWFALLAVAHSAAKITKEMQKNCTAEFNIEKGDFLSYEAHHENKDMLFPRRSHGGRKPKSTHQHDHSTLNWPDFGQPLTFYVKLMGKEHHSLSTQVGFIVQLKSPATELTNCFLSTYCNPVLTCCYDRELPEAFSMRYRKTCPPTTNCRRGAKVKPCKAICFRHLVINVAFEINVPEFGGSVIVSVDYQTQTLRQTRRAFTGEQFRPVARKRVSANRTTVLEQRFSSPLSETYTGFWIRYIKEHTRLQVGLDGKREPMVNVELWDTPLLIHSVNATNANRDTYGWLGDEVGGFEGSFTPTHFQFNIPRGGQPANVLVNCSNIIFTDWGQTQRAIGGSCVTSNQCPRGHRCLEDTKMSKETSWVHRKVCRKYSGNFLESHWVSAIIAATLLLLALSLALSHWLYLKNNNVKMGQTYMAPVEPSKKVAVNNYQVIEKQADKDKLSNRSMSPIQSQSKRQRKLEELSEFHRLSRVDTDENIKNSQSKEGKVN